MSKIDIYRGGHCKLSGNDTVGNFLIKERLGRGRFATVWSAYDKNNNTKVAIKIYRHGIENERYYRNEVEIFKHLVKYSLETQQIPRNIIGYIDTVAHIDFHGADTPRIHPCVLFNLAGSSVSSIIKYCQKTYKSGLPMSMVKKIMRDTLTGLDYIHSCGLIHTDIKPSNLLLSSSIDFKNPDVSVLIGDLGSSTHADNIFSDTVGTVQYCAPELLIDLPYTSAIDIWSAFTMCFELITGDLLFDVYSDCDIYYGEDMEKVGGLYDCVDMENEPETDKECVEGECGKGDRCEESESCKGDLCEDMKLNKESVEFSNNIEDAAILIDPSQELSNSSFNSSPRLSNSSEGFSNSSFDSFSNSSSSSSSSSSSDTETNYRHLLLIEKIIGPAPHEFTSNARLYYNRRDKLKNNPEITYISINDLLQANYGLEPDVCLAIEEFLMLGLKYIPEQRITAKEALNHPWLYEN